MLISFHNATPASYRGSFSHASRFAVGTVYDQSPEALAAWERRRDLDAARWNVEQAEESYADARAQLGKVSCQCAKRADYRPPAWKRTKMRANAFAVLNRSRGALIRARKALAALLNGAA